MKKIWLILTVAIIGFGQIMAQDGYTPFVREGVQWVCYFVHYWDNDYMGFQPGQTFFTLELKGDTVIDGKEYKMMHKYSGIGVNPDDDTFPGGVWRVVGQRCGQQPLQHGQIRTRNHLV